MTDSKGTASSKAPKIEIKRIDIREFREQGFLQEANRQFFHPLGLALEVVVDEDGSERLGGVWDYREDPEGMAFAELPINDCLEKAKRVDVLRRSKWDERVRRFGFGIQQIGKAVHPR